MTNFVGRMVRTIRGELDQDEEGQERVTPAGALGFLADQNQPGQWAAHFGDAVVYLEESDLADAQQYQHVIRLSDVGLEPAQAQEAQRRIEAVSDLLRSAGPAYTFWRHAVDASLANADGFAGVDWSAVHLATIQDSVGNLLQPPEDVLEALRTHSPGAISDVQIAAIGEQLRVVREELTLQSEAATSPSLG